MVRNPNSFHLTSFHRNRTPNPVSGTAMYVLDDFKKAFNGRHIMRFNVSLSSVRRDAGDASSKSMVKVIGIGSPTVSSEEVPITNLLKGITVDEGAVIHAKRYDCKIKDEYQHLRKLSILCRQQFVNKGLWT
ncbi:hypothetical protein L1887_04530 [Cichorium endivia]|nr:hypothetical protein L1887_04530 [Cichorium endivia]